MVRLVPTTAPDAHKIGRARARSELFAAFYFPAAVQFLLWFRVFQSSMYIFELPAIDASREVRF